MKPISKTIEVQILDKEYPVSCPEGEESSLMATAEYVNQKMLSIKKAGRTVGLERIAVMAALNITHELLQAQATLETDAKKAQHHIQKISNKIEAAIGE